MPKYPRGESLDNKHLLTVQEAGCLRSGRQNGQVLARPILADACLLSDYKLHCRWLIFVNPSTAQALRAS